MNRIGITVVLIAAFGAVACQPDDGGYDSAVAATTPAATVGSADNAPITLDYALVGAPLVGEPVAVNVEISTPASDQAIRLTYRSAEEGDMTFPESQAAETTLPPLSNGNTRRHQFSVIPQREGRIFVVVSAALETERGATIKSISIPVQVRRAGDAGSDSER